MTPQWQDLLQQHPDWTPRQRAEWIAKQEGIAASTIANYARDSPDPQVRQDANRARSQVAEGSHDITGKWAALLESQPTMTPADRARLIATETGLSPQSVATLARASRDKRVKREGDLAGQVLADDKHHVVERWHEFGKTDPQVTAEEKAQVISKDTNLSVLTVTRLLRGLLTNPAEKRALGRAYNVIREKSLDITGKWLVALQDKTLPTATGRARKVATETGLAPSTAAGLARFSENPDVKRDSIDAEKQLTIERHDLTGRWRRSIDQEPDLFPVERAVLISRDVGINPNTLTSNLRASLDEEVKREASIARNAIDDKGRGIAKLWLQSLEDHPTKSTRERARIIATRANLTPYWALQLAVALGNKRVKASAWDEYMVLVQEKKAIIRAWYDLQAQETSCPLEDVINNLTASLSLPRDEVAEVIYYISTHGKKPANRPPSAIKGEQQYDITEQWLASVRASPDLTPVERIQQLATGLDLPPVVVARYAKASKDRAVRKGGNKAFLMMEDTRYGITQEWCASMDAHPSLAPEERAKQIATDKNLSVKLVVSLARVSPNQDVRQEGRVLYQKRLDEKYDITGKWVALIKHETSLSPLGRAQKIAEDTRLSVATVAGVASYSTNPRVSIEGKRAYNPLSRVGFKIPSGGSSVFVTTQPAPPIVPDDELRARTLLPVAFWDALNWGRYPRKSSETPPYRVEDLAPAFKGVGYFDSVDVYGFVLIVVAIKNACYVGIHFSGEEGALIGAIEYHPARRRRFLKYLDYRALSFPLGLDLLRKVRVELEGKGVLLHEIRRKTGALPLRGAIKYLGAVTRWEYLTTTSPHLPPDEKAKVIAPDLDLDPITVANYASFSEINDVKTEVHLAARVLEIQLHDLTTKWQALLAAQPSLLPENRVKLLGDATNLDPTTVAMLGGASENPEVRRDANRARTIVYDEKQGITDAWRGLIQSRPELSPLDRAKIVAAPRHLSPGTVAVAAQSSKDRQVAREARVAGHEFGAASYEVTSRWVRVRQAQPTLSSYCIAEGIAKTLGIAITTLCAYGRRSADKSVRREAERASRDSNDHAYNISPQWKASFLEHPDWTPAQRVAFLARECNLQPSSIINVGRYSPDARIVRDAREAEKTRVEDTHHLTDRWLQSKQKDPTLTPAERAQRIAAECSLTPLTVAKWAADSAHPVVALEGSRAGIQIFLQKYRVTEVWRRHIDVDPALPPLERLEHISQEIGVRDSSIAFRAQQSPDRQVKAEALACHRALMLAKHGITQKWVETRQTHPDMGPDQIAQLVAGDLDIKASSVASYGQSSPDLGVRREANLAGKLLLEAKHAVTRHWQSLHQEFPKIPPEECARRIGEACQLSPFTVTSLAGVSKDPAVRAWSLPATMRLKDVRHQITESLHTSMRTRPHLNPLQHVEGVSAATGLTPISVMWVARYSPDSEIRDEVWMAFREFNASKTGLGEK